MGLSRLAVTSRAISNLEPSLPRSPACSSPPSLSSSAVTSSLSRLRQLHAKLIREGGIRDILTAGKLLSDIVSTGPVNIGYAFSVFASIDPPLNTFTWNSMIRGLAHGSRPWEAMALYRRMLAEGCPPNNYTYPFVLTACASIADAGLGLSVHGTLVRRGFEDSDMFIQTALLNYYAARGSIDIARQLFERCPKRDVALWNALIKGYMRSCRYSEAIGVFRRMQNNQNVRSDEVTMLCVVSACAHLGALDMGRWVHAYIDKNRMRLSLNLGTALVNMYSKCGEIETAYFLFEKMREKDVRAWSVMIGGFAFHGDAAMALELFSKMEVMGINPDSVTFTGVLSACSHAGLVQEGLQILKQMERFHGVHPTIEHYGCVVDLLGRAGQLEKALELIKEIPLELDVVLWGALLVACRVHKNVMVGELVAQEMLQLDPDNAGALVFLSNVYASTGRWEKVEEVRMKMREHKIQKPPGSSLIEVDGLIHEFISGDSSHPDTNQIYMMLDEISKLRGLDGSCPTTSGVSFDLGEEDKEQCVSQHSEKLAVAFGLIKTQPGTAIRIIKNLRICDDCHYVMKLVSKAFGRVVIVRDRTRFHHFRDGSCSCRDYW